MVLDKTNADDISTIRATQDYIDDKLYIKPKQLPLNFL